MKRTIAMTIALAVASLGTVAYAQTAPATQGDQTTHTGKKKHHAKKARKNKADAAATTR